MIYSYLSLETFDTMNEVWSCYKQELDKVETCIKKEVDSEVSLINAVIWHILSSGGKRIRPLLLIICARLCRYTGRDHITLAAVIEFMHTATLLHDDVIDNAKIRRGIPSARVLWGNRESILAGDYLYTLAIRQAIQMEHSEINHMLSSVCCRATEGEALQLVHNHDLGLTEESYLKIVEYKTAALISASCHLGAMVAGASEEHKETLKRFGKNLGIAFQVADDILDYTADVGRLGKSLGKDLKEGKITLPLLHLLKHCKPKERIRLKKIILSGKVIKAHLDDVISLMDRYGSGTYAIERAQDYVDRAKSDLSCFEDSEPRRALFAVADYVVRRDC